jgi:hypothetical protein
MNTAIRGVKSILVVGSLFVLLGCGGGEISQAPEKKILLEGNLDGRIALARNPIYAEWATAAERAATTSIDIDGLDGTTLQVVLRFSKKHNDVWVVRATVADCDASSELELRFTPEGLRDTSKAATLLVRDCEGRSFEPVTLDLGDFSQFAAPFQITRLERIG